MVSTDPDCPVVATFFAFLGLNIDDDQIGLINEDVVIRRVETRVDDPPP